jgi:hypothetical protein
MRSLEEQKAAYKEKFTNDDIRGLLNDWQSQLKGGVHDDYTLLLKRYKDYIAKETKRTLSQEQLDTKKNQLDDDLLRLIKNLTNEDFIVGVVKPEKEYGILKQKPLVLKVTAQEKAALEKIDTSKKMGEVAPVSCDRKLNRSDFRKHYKQTESNPLFYLASSCLTQKPQSFCERMILEIIDEFSNDLDVCFKTISNTEGRPDKIKLPFDGDESLAWNQQKFKQEFVKLVFPSNPNTSFEEFMAKGVEEIGFEKCFLIYEFHDNNWDIDFLAYIAWILETFSQINQAGTQFMLFFVYVAPRLHKHANNEHVQELQQLFESAPQTKVLPPFVPFNYDFIEDWFLDHIVDCDKRSIQHLLTAFEVQRHDEHYDMMEVEPVLTALYKLHLGAEMQVIS